MPLERTSWVESPDLVSIGSGALHPRLETALSYLERIGIRVPPTCRARNAARLLGRLNRDEEAISRDDPAQLSRIQAGYRTAWETFLITFARWEARRDRWHPFTKEKLSALLGGPDVIEGRKTIARDTQFELYIAANLRLGGVEVRGGEPDVRFKLGYERFGIAAKRISSADLGQLRRHATKAAHQIETTGRRGFIAINLDSRFAATRVEQERSVLLGEFDAVFDSVNELLPELTELPHVAGVMVFGYATEWVFSDQHLPRILIAAPFRWLGWSNDPAERLLFDEFMRRWRSGLEQHVALLFSSKFPNV